MKKETLMKIITGIFFILAVMMIIRGYVVSPKNMVLIFAAMVFALIVNIINLIRIIRCNRK